MKRLIAGPLIMLAVGAVHCGTGRGTDDHAAARAVEPAYQARFAARTRGTGVVTVYELFDFQCPFCREFTLHTFPAIDSAYVQTGKIRWVVINNPIERHANAEHVAEVMICAGRAGRFWELSDRVLDQQARWSELERPDSVLYALASSVGIDSTTLRQCVQTGAGRAEVRADAAFLAAMGIQREGVPVFLVSGRKVAQGAQPFSAIRRVLDSLVAAHPLAAS
jgi:protein-disulfide isomerase